MDDNIQIYYLAGGKHWSLGFVCKLAFRLQLLIIVHSTYQLIKIKWTIYANKLLIYEIIICFDWFHDCVSPFKYITSQEENIGHWVLFVNWLSSTSLLLDNKMDNMSDAKKLLIYEIIICFAWVPWLCFTIQIYYLAGGKHWSLVHFTQGRQ